MVEWHERANIILIRACWCLMVMEIWVKIAPGNGLLPDGTKPLPEPKLTYNQSGFVVFTSEQFCRKWSRYLSLMSWILQQYLPGGQWVNRVPGLSAYQMATAATLDLQWYIQWSGNGSGSCRLYLQQNIFSKVWFCLFTIASCDWYLSLQ